MDWWIMVDFAHSLLNRVIRKEPYYFSGVYIRGSSDSGIEGVITVCYEQCVQTLNDFNSSKWYVYFRNSVFQTTASVFTWYYIVL